MRVGVIDTGGGLRGVYAAGVFDTWIDQGVTFDAVIGVSAGSANAVSFLAGQRGRNYTFYTEYSQRPQYMSLRNFLKTRSYLNLEYVYGTLSNNKGEYPLDYGAMQANPADFIVVATDARTGRPMYFGHDHIQQDDYGILMASSAIPFVCRPKVIRGVPYYDGALSDPIPWRKAFDLGCDKVVVILTRPKDTVRSPGLDTFFAKRIRREFPAASAKLMGRAETYNHSIEKAREYEREGRLLLIAPDSIGEAKTLSRKKEPLDILYHKGRKDAEAIHDFLRSPITSKAKNSEDTKDAAHC